MKHSRTGYLILAVSWGIFSSRWLTRLLHSCLVCRHITRMPLTHHLLCLACYTIQCLQSILFSGILYGWASLYTIFLESGTYANRCADDTGLICDEQKRALQFIYTAASSANLASQLLWGMVLDRFGPRICGSSSCLGVIAGLLMLSLDGPAFDGALWGVIVFGASGPGVQISLFHISELFPSQKSTVLAVISGSFQLSFTVFLLFRVVSQHSGLTLSQLSLLYCVPLLVLFAVGLAVWPDHPYSAALSTEDDGSLQVDVERTGTSAIVSDEEVPLKRTAAHEREIALAQQTLAQQLFSRSFLGVLLWMTVCLFWANFYIGTVVEQLYLKSGEEPEPTRLYTDVFNLLLPVGVVGIPLFGHITDTYGFTWSIVTTSALAILYAGVSLLGSLPVQVCGFVAYSFFRTFLFSLMFAYLASEFGFVNFGRLSGILLCLAGGIGFLQYPLQTYLAARLGPFSAVDLAQFVTLCLTLFFALYHYRREKRKGWPGLSPSARPRRLSGDVAHARSRVHGGDGASHAIDNRDGRAYGALDGGHY